MAWSIDNPQPMKNGQCIALHVWCGEKGVGVCRIENVGVVTDDGWENFFTVPYDGILIPPYLGIEAFRCTGIVAWRVSGICLIRASLNSRRFQSSPEAAATDSKLSCRHQGVIKVNQGVKSTLSSFLIYPSSFQHVY